LKVNLKTRDFDLYVYKELNGMPFETSASKEGKFTKQFIEYFKDYWGEKPGFKLKYYIGLNVEDL
jgi:hypothetical protein